MHHDRNIMITRVCALLGLLLLRGSVHAVVNTLVERHFDASKAVVEVNEHIEVSGIEHNTYEIAISTMLIPHLALLKVFLSEIESELFPHPVDSDGPYALYNVSVPSQKASLRIYSVYTKLLEPHPAVISQDEPQRVVFRLNQYFTSPYFTEKQSTTLKLSSHIVETYSKEEPYSLRGSVLKYGPYLEIFPFARNELSVHYVNNYPFRQLAFVSRTIDITHPSRVTVQDAITLRHGGARLDGPFSRKLHEEAGVGASPVFQTLRAVLPGHASGVYYRDDLGNVSSSQTSTVRDITFLDINTRYPLCGGMRTSFFIGYSIPVGLDSPSRRLTPNPPLRFLLSLTRGRGNSSSNDQKRIEQMELSFDLCPMFDDAWIDSLEVKVVLPEHTANVEPHCDNQCSIFAVNTSADNGRYESITIVAKAHNLVRGDRRKVVIAFSQERLPAVGVMLWFMSHVGPVLLTLSAVLVAGIFVGRLRIDDVRVAI